MWPALATEKVFFLCLLVCRLNIVNGLWGSQVSVLLNGMLDHSFRERSLRKTRGSRLAEQVLNHWDMLKPWWTGPSSSPESKTSTLTLLSKVLQVPEMRPCTWCYWTLYECLEKMFTCLNIYVNILTSIFLPSGLSSFCPQIDASVSTNTSHPAFAAVFCTFTALITDTALPLNLKVMTFFEAIPTYGSLFICVYWEWV